MAGAIAPFASHQGPKFFAIAMIAVVYGKPYVPFVADVAEALCTAVRAQGAPAEAICIESALAERKRIEEAERSYILPFDAADAQEAARLVSQVLPKARPLVPFWAQDLCWDKIATEERLVERGVGVPETLVTHTGSDVLEFVRRYRFAILKRRCGCAGVGHWVLWLEDGTLMADNGTAAYRLEFNEGPPRIVGDRLIQPPPYYVQRMIGTYVQGQFWPGQVLRAYVVDDEICFWTERFRDRYRRPGDWILNVSLGARYRFVLSVREETENAALRTARAVGAPVAAVDLIHTSATGPLVLEVNTDGYHMVIDRSFKNLPEYRNFFDFDFYIARLLARKETPPDVRAARFGPRRKTRYPRGNL